MNINVTFEETRNHPVLAVVDAVLADVKETDNREQYIENLESAFEDIVGCYVEDFVKNVYMRTTRFPTPDELYWISDEKNAADEFSALNGLAALALNAYNDDSLALKTEVEEYIDDEEERHRNSDSYDEEGNEYIKTIYDMCVGEDENGEPIVS